MAKQTTSAIYAIKLLDEAEKFGVLRDVVCKEAGIHPREISENDSPLLLNKYIALVDRVLSEDSVPDDLGFLVGEHTNILEHGLLGYSILHGANIKECIKRYLRFQSIPGSILDVSFVEGGDEVALSISPKYAANYCSVRVLQYLIQEWLANMNIWKDLTNFEGEFFSAVKAIAPITVAVSEKYECYQNHVFVPIESHGSGAEVWFKKEYLNLPLAVRINANIDRVCQVQCEKIIKDLKRNRGWAMEVHKQLSLFPGELLSMGDMAEKFHITPRTLRRRLKDEGTCYTDLVVEFRLSMAKQYLRESDLPISEVSDLVGYKNTANFYRSFLKEFDVTPKQYRQIHVTGRD